MHRRACGPRAPTRPAAGPRPGFRATNQDWRASHAALAADEAVVAGRARRMSQADGLLAPPMLDRPFQRLPRCIRISAEGGRDVALRPGLLLPQRHQAAVRGNASAY